MGAATVAAGEVLKTFKQRANNFSRKDMSRKENLRLWP